jgi:hypothetical protein
LRDDDLDRLGLRSDESGPYAEGSRLIDNNLTCDQSMMINGTVGTEGFFEPKHVEILNNVARHQSMMVNTSLSIEEMDKNRNYQLDVIKTLAKSGHIGKDQISQALQKSHPRTTDRVRTGRVERAKGMWIAMALR